MTEHVTVSITDGCHVEVFAGPNVRAKVFNVPVAQAGEGEILAEQWMRRSLPRSYATLWYPGNCRAEEIARVITPADLVKLGEDVAWRDTLNEIQSLKPFWGEK